MIKGVNFFGPYEARDSIGRAAFSNISCLEAANIENDVYRLSRPTPDESVDYATIDEKLISSLKYRINIFHFNARRVPLYFSRLGENALNGFYNIGFWVHEMPSIPSSWANQLEFFDEIWTPSSICQNAVALSSNIPVVRFSYPIDERSVSSRIDRTLSGFKTGNFNFLSVFDVYSDAERKNPLFTVRAFLDAHAGSSSVRLILKTRNLSHDQFLAKKLAEIAKRHTNIVVIDGFMQEDELSELYENADAYVSLHRAEGFGFTISDAMSRGIPVIATGYSGNLDFCNTDVRLVAYSLREVGHNRPRYRSSDVWAEPDLEDATEAFSDMVANQFLWTKRAKRARSRLEREFSVASIGKLMRNRLELISQNFIFPDDMSERQIDFELGVSQTYGF